MIGIVLISHGGLAEGILTSAPMLFPEVSQCESLTLWPEDNPDDFQRRLEEKVRQVDTGDGVFILADLLGGTPCNRAIYLMGERVRILTGLSLPMLVTLLSLREESCDFDAIAEEVLESTRIGTVDVNQILKEGAG